MADPFILPLRTPYFYRYFDVVVFFSPLTHP